MGMPWRGVHAPSNLTVTSLAVAMPPELLAAYHSEGNYPPRVVPPKQRKFALLGKAFAATFSS